MPGKLSELTPIPAINGTSIFEVLHAGQTEAVTAAVVLAYVSANINTDSAIVAKLTTNTVNKTATSGNVVGQSSDMDVAPSGTTTATYFARRDQLNWNSSVALSTGGWLTAHESVVNIAGSSTLDKVVVNLSQANLTGTVTVSAALGYEAEVSSISSGAAIASYCGFYFPNLQNVTNINRITTLAAFVNDDSSAVCRTQGPFYNATLQEFAPPYHPGISTGRYYSAPYWYLGEGAAGTGVAYCVPVYVPHRITIGQIGFQVTTAVGGAKARLALFTSEKGKVQNRVWQSGEIDCATTGVKEASVATRVEAGTYWLALTTNTTVGINFHSPQSADIRGSLFGAPAANTSEGNHHRAAALTFSYASYPSTVGIVPNFTNGDSEPHLWYRL